ncbi:MAG: serine/threonine protein kinase, partial [Bacteroidales bacterium]|nr:serine/threonine protein kinase [Bacteroidales bacterium]
MKKITIIASLIFVFGACKNGENRDVLMSNSWPIFRGNPSLTGYTDVSLPDEPVLLWSFKSDAYTKSSLVVYNRVAYWSDRRGRIFGVNTDGKQVFNYALETAVDATPMIFDSTLYIGRIDGFLSAISLAKQDTVWNFETSGQISASPNVMDLDG